MRCLWLTLADPDPAHNGQYIYSAGLINAVAAAGVELVVLGLKRPNRDAAMVPARGRSNGDCRSARSGRAG